MSKFSLLKDIQELSEDFKTAHIIQIYPLANYERGSNNEVIEGFLKNEIDFDFSAGWKPAGEKSILSFLTTLAKPFEDYSRVFSGTAISDAGFLTRKVYSGGTDLSLSADFRIIDINADGKPLQMVRTLMSYMVPLQKADISFSGGSNFASELQNQTGNDDLKFKDPAPEGEEQPKQGIQDSINKVTDGVKVLKSSIGQRALSELKNYGLSVTQAPTPVSIKVGNYLYINDAVITSANAKLSHQKTTEGPLFVDVSLKISTRENLVLTERADGEGYSIRGIGLGGQDGESTHTKIPKQKDKKERTGQTRSF
jgi:hypothetical protein